MHNALDSLLINHTLWNYTAHNKNDLRVGDCWNQEDLSIFSEDQRDDVKEEIQELTKKYETQASDLAKHREKEVMEN